MIRSMTGNPYTDFPLPSSKDTVSVRMIDVFHRGFPQELFFEPNVSVAPLVPLAGWAFMLEHARTGHRVMFDLGVRQDFENLAPAVVEQFGDLSWNVGEDVPTQLVKNSIPLHSIDAVIWSHSHFDHVGDMSKFPSSTRLFVGPGTLANALPAYPTKKDSWNLESDFQGHDVTELTFDGPKIAGQKTHDFFGDGSLMLINMPGHIAGNIAALVRVTSEKEDSPWGTYILLAGDVAHHLALIRPTPADPLPDSFVRLLPASLLATDAPPFEDPLVQPAKGTTSLNQDVVTAVASMEKLRRFDGRPDVWVILAHDASLRAWTGKPNGIGLFPQALDAWKEKGWKDLTRFAFLEPGNDANLWTSDAAP